MTTLPSGNDSTTKINDVTLRDGHQSLLSGRVMQGDLLKVAVHLAKAGFERLEVWGGTTFDIPVSFKGEDPFANLRGLRDAIQQSAAEAGVKAPKLSMLLRGENLVGYRPYNEEITKEFIAQAAEDGVQVFRIFDALNDARKIETSIKAAVEYKNAHPEKDIEVEGTISFTKLSKKDRDDLRAQGRDDDAKNLYTVEACLKYAQKLKDMGCTSICVKDMAGMMTPADVKGLIPKLKELGLPIVLHTHSSMGLSDATIQEAIRQGVDQVDTGCSALANGSGQSTVENVTEQAERHGLTDKIQPVNMQHVEAANRELRQIRAKYTEFEVPYMEGLEEKLRDAQVPGGMLATLAGNIKDQLWSAYKDKPLTEDEKRTLLFFVLDEIRAVRADAGYVSLVTPSSQTVGSQAVNNVQSYLGASRNADGSLKRPAKLSPSEIGEHRYKNMNANFTILVCDVAERVAADPDERLCTMPKAELVELAHIKREKQSADAAQLFAKPMAAFTAEAKAITGEEDPTKLQRQALILALNKNGHTLLEVLNGKKQRSDVPEFKKFDDIIARAPKLSSVMHAVPELAERSVDAIEHYLQLSMDMQRHDDIRVRVPADASKQRNYKSMFADCFDEAAIAREQETLTTVREAVQNVVRDVYTTLKDDNPRARHELLGYLNARGKALGLNIPKIAQDLDFRIPNYQHPPIDHSDWKSRTQTDKTGRNLGDS